MSTTSETVPHEADWDEAPGLRDGAMDVELTPQQCNLSYWINAVPQGTWRGLVNGHTPGAAIPPFMQEDGPLRDSALQEFAFRSMSEDKAVRALAYMVPIAPTVDELEFFSTQMLDEARHAMVFRNHLVELGVPQPELQATMHELAGEDSRLILEPMERWGLPIVRDQADYIGGVVLCSVLIEGVLAPLAELSERKWEVLDPAGAEIDRGANIDEIRHLSVTASIVRRHLLDHPEDKDRLLELITGGRELWASTPIAEIIYRREKLYQEGMERQADFIGDYEIDPGKRLVDTTAEERLGLALQWSNEVQESRLRYMGLEEAI